MKNWNVALLAAFAGTVAGVAPSALAGTGSIPSSIAERGEQDVRMLAQAMLPLMPKDHREAIIAAGGLGSDAFVSDVDETGWSLVSHDERFERLSDVVSPALFARVGETHLAAMLSSRERAEAGGIPVGICFAPDTDPDLVAAMNTLFEQEMWGIEPGTRFQLSTRWTSTASSFSTGPQGSPITLTYSFAPDNSLADNLSGANRQSRLFAWLNGIYGSPTVWQPLFHSVFDRWGELIGVEYIYEPNDDGAEANTLPGLLGVRGDVRIFAVQLDGNFNVLAYNQFPNAGDMVFDAFDSFYSSTSQNSRRLRNVASHEHGHGLGFAHVCPINNSKLMEPTASTSFDGPQLDEIMGGQRHYGDPFEENDNAGEANDFGDWFIGRSESYVDLSIDDDSDVDWFRINVTQPLEIVVEVNPDAGQYFQGPQFGGSCPSGSLTDYNSNQDLNIKLRDAGQNLLATADDTGLGEGEELRFTITTPGEYFIVVDDPNTFISSIQRYRMDISGAAVPFDGPSIAAQQSVPAAVAPGAPLELDFEILANADTIIDGPDLRYRFDGGTYISVPLSPLGGDLYRATVPAAACDDNPEFYISVVGQTVGEVNLPTAGVADPFSYAVGTLELFFEDDFETDVPGYSILSTASAGDWERGVPVASDGAPPSDFDGSGQCYVTGNSPGEDVDGGRVILRTPALDLENGGQFSYAYWFSSGSGSFIGDSFLVQYSTNGQITWIDARTYLTDSNGWQTDTIEIDADTGVNNMYFRFVVEDGGTFSTVEAAVDAISVGNVTCDDAPQGCNAADIAPPLGVLDLADINAFVDAFTGQQPAADIAPPFGVFDLSDVSLFTSEFTAGCP